MLLTKLPFLSKNRAHKRPDVFLQDIFAKILAIQHGTQRGGGCVGLDTRVRIRTRTVEFSIGRLSPRTSQKTLTSWYKQNASRDGSCPLPASAEGMDSGREQPGHFRGGGYNNRVLFGD